MSTVSQDKGYDAMLDLVSYYKENATILRKTFKDMGFSVYGGENAPYVWVGFPGQASWDVFADILHKCNIVTTPGSGFGPAGEGFVRASAFGHRSAPFLAMRFNPCMQFVTLLASCAWRHVHHALPSVYVASEAKQYSTSSQALLS